MLCTCRWLVFEDGLDHCLVVLEVGHHDVECGSEHGSLAYENVFDNGFVALQVALHGGEGGLELSFSSTIVATAGMPQLPLPQLAQPVAAAIVAASTGTSAVAGNAASAAVAPAAVAPVLPLWEPTVDRQAVLKVIRQAASALRRAQT